jgi:ATP-binding cassette subfamily B protein
MALLRKLPRLNDRYFQSRPITDMADRNHNIYAIRNVPGMALELVQTVFELVLTLAGVILIAPDTTGLAVLLVTTAAAIPLAVQPLLNERDLRVRNHAGALHGFYLDALLGLAPVRAHRAERSVRRQHEGLLVEWAQSLRGWMLTALANEAIQATACTALAGAVLVAHLLRAGQVRGSDLLLIFWVLKLPALGAGLAGLAHRYPAQRNALLRLLEPLTAPEDFDGHAPAASAPPAAGGVGIVLRAGRILAGGHEILRDLDLSIRPGEHIAIVGPSGAGKSSLLGLLLGWHRLSQGELLVDGTSHDSAGVERLRRVTAWVDPAVQIWNRTLLENLQYAADDGGLDRIGEVIAAARLRGVAQNLSQGLQSLLGEGGGKLSGGEGQRVRLGRALFAQGTRLALLDEPFRGLDREQRRALLADARAWWTDVTLLCVTHDLAETRAFDRVLVIEGGRIVEDGAPTTLAAGATRYRDLLEAETRLQTALWQGGHWRRLSMVEGRLQAAGDAR